MWGLSTLSALVLLFGYSTSTSGPATSAPPSLTSTPPVSSSGTTSPTQGSTGSAPATSATSAASARKTVTGSVAQTQWGPVQVQLRVRNGRITKVSVVQYPNGNGNDQAINSQALPILTQETVDSQSANIDMVSGATVTSDGYVESLQSALDRAGL